MKRTLACLMAVAAMSNAVASTYSGPVPVTRVLPSTIVPNAIRFGVFISGVTTSCSLTGWYGMDMPDTSATAKAWMAILLSAQARGANVIIAGNGVCDSYGNEGIWYIDAVP
jgi:hypothetical protein